MEGIVGLGRMGSAIARRLIEAGHHVKVYNRTRSRSEALKQAGASGEAVITMLADDPAVEVVVFGPHGVLQGLGKKSGAYLNEHHHRGTVGRGPSRRGPTLPRRAGIRPA